MNIFYNNIEGITYWIGGKGSRKKKSMGLKLEQVFYMNNVRYNPLVQIIQNSISTRKALPFHDLFRGINGLFRGAILPRFGITHLVRRIMQTSLIEITESNLPVWNISTDDFTALKDKQTIWMKIDGIAPADSAELSYVATDTSSPYTTTFDGKYAGKIVFYWLRWVNTRGEHGPWSSTISAIVAG